MAEPLEERAFAPRTRVRHAAASAAVKRTRTHVLGKVPLPAVVCLAVLLITGALTALSFVLYQNNEDRLLRLRAREIGLVLQEAIVDIQTPLASAAALADATAGNVTRFKAFAAGYGGPGKQFASVSLWARDGSVPLAVVGSTPELASSPAEVHRFLARVGRRHTVSVMLLAAPNSLRLGYGYRQATGGYIAYGESLLSPTRRAVATPASSPFSDVHYALYLGRRQTAPTLLTTDLPSLPPSGRSAMSVVGFGDSALTLVVTPRGSLGGAFFELLPWIIAGIGTLLALTAGLTTDRLIRRRVQAEGLAEHLDQRAREISELFDEQREIARTLQDAIVPEALAAPPGLETAAIYHPGTDGIAVGGDWYELIKVADGCMLGVVGDVSGHGLRAATTMATLRTATFAYAARDARPGWILQRLSELVARKPHNYFATVLCMLIDVDAREVTLASAGHLPPLLISQSEASYPTIAVGPPIGAVVSDYHEVRLSVEAGTTIIAFTDGLVERRGEIIDIGLDRLRDRALAGRQRPLAELLDALNRELVPEPARDDTAILAVRWQP